MRIGIRRKLVVFVMVILLLGCFPVTGIQAEEAPSPGAVFYVSNDGSGSNPGTLEAPFQTLEEARDAIRELKQDEGLPDGGVTVYLRGGVYNRAGSFLLEEQDSGTADKPITYQAYPGESVRLNGGLALEKSWFTAVSDPAILNRIISEDARTKVLQADLKGHGITDYGVMSRHGYYKANDVSEVPPMELYIDGQDMTLARWPNNGTVQMGDIIDAGPTRKDPDLQTRGGTFKYTYQRPELWSQADDIWLDGIFGYSWEWSYNKIASIDTTNKTITLAYGEMSGLFKNWYPDFHFAQNLLEEIDMPGEYYIDRSEGVLYFMPTVAFQADDPEITVSMLNTPMINAVNVSHVNFEDLILENGRDSAVVIMGGDSVQIVHCEIRNFANGGVQINTPSRWLYNDFAKADGVNHAVISTHIHHIGGTGVILNGGDRLTLEPGNNAVVNSHIHDFAYYHKAYNPAVILTGAGNRVTGSEIHDAPHPGILIFGNDHLVENNNIYDVCKTFSDLGAIYMNLGAAPQERGSIIRGNYFHNIGEGKAGVQGVYPDNFTMGITIEENIFYKMGNSAILNNGGAHNQTRNNLFIDAKVPYEFADLYLGDAPEQQISKNYMGPWHDLFDRYNNFEGMPHLEKYPELADFFTENRYYPDTNTFENNVVYNPTKTRSSATNENGALDNLDLVQYANNWVTDQDPGFVDLAGGDLNLKEDAEVFEQIPGFQTIPFSEMGTTGKVGPYLAPDVIPIEEVQLYEDAVTIGIGKKYSLYAEVLPWNASSQDIQYVSSDPDIVKVDADGTLKGINLGNAVVTAFSADNPLLKDEIQVTVEVGDGIMEYTDFENGRNEWPSDANRSVVAMDDGNHMYKLLKGATTLNENEFSNYELSFKMKTPPTIAGAATFYIFDRQDRSGTSGRIGYRKLADGTASWLLYNGAWATVKENKLEAPELLPDTVYNIKVIVKGAEISVYLNDELKLKAADPTHIPSGRVGFYAGGFDYLLFDDIKFAVPGEDVTGLLLDKSSYNMVMGEQLPLTVQFDPSDAADREVVWESSNPEIASVDESGVVTALAKGETVITVTSTVNPAATASAAIIISDILISTDFESGASGWPVDPNRSIVTVNSNKMYRIVKGANALHPKTVENYEMTFKLKTPAVIPELGTFYVYDRQVSGKSGIIGYKKFADGSSKWILYNKDWAELETNVLPDEDLLPDTEYEFRIVADGANIRVYVDGELKLEGSNPSSNPSGTIGFYVGGFSELWFDDIVVSMAHVPVTAIQASPDHLALEPGGSRQIEATVVPSDATSKGINWSSSDPSVATVTDTGLATGVSEGTAVITAESQEDPTLKAEIPVTVQTSEYPIINLDDHLSDSEHWTVSDSVYHTDGTVEMYGNGVYGYDGAKFGSGLIRFKAKIDGYGTGWYGFAIRSERAGDPTWVGSNQGYLVVIKEYDIELQSWKPGQTMIQIIPNTVMPAGGEYEIEFGAVQTEEGERVILKVDGNTVLNFLDTDENNPIASEGYFNVYNYTGAVHSIELKPVNADPGTDPVDPEPPVDVSPVSASGILSGMQTVQEGQLYELTLGLNQVTGEIVGEDLTVGFDPELFEFVSAEALLPNFNIVTHTEDSDNGVRLILSSGGNDALSADGDLLKLTFAAKSTDQQAEGLFTAGQHVITNTVGEESEVVTAPHSVTILDILPGDLNGDGKFSIGDLGILVGMYGRTSADPEWSIYEAADLNDDGEIGIMDLTLIARKLTGQ
ncbi:Ig-like domain-containing protein [Paenibacillus sp. HB172176]|uniref:Ig-like domain-containing protein n=1 Tax=Paenibacillus sp. HB172176 TaxID=2493690 RepID=UPI001439DFC6|nr:Ig-like domain-containing protein [Paenibacillus sp. HB172176]